MADLIALTHEDAEEVAELVAEFYPEALRPDLEQTREGLDGEFCLGVHRNGALDGVLLAWLDNTLVEGRREQVVFVEDLIGESADIEVLFERVLAEVEQGTAIEGIICNEAQPELLQNGSALSSLGYGLSGSHTYRCESSGEMMTWVRFEPARQDPPEDLWDGTTFEG